MVSVDVQEQAGPDVRRPEKGIDDEVFGTTNGRKMAKTTSEAHMLRSQLLFL